MKVLYTKKFNKDIDQITTDVEGTRKIQGYDTYYRIRVGDFRLGIKLTNDGIEMLRFLHRKDIYRRFP